MGLFSGLVSADSTEFYVMLPLVLLLMIGLPVYVLHKVTLAVASVTGVGIYNVSDAAAFFANREL